MGKPRCSRITLTSPAPFTYAKALKPASTQVGTHSRWVSQLLEQLGHRVTVATHGDSSSFLSLEDKGRFTSSRQGGAYLGLRPKQDQSGDTDKQLHITKAGDAFLRRLLVNCATYILGPFGAESDLRSWGLQLSSRGGKSAKRRARVAVARKRAVLMHRLWVTGEEYEPVGSKPKPAAA